jgi:LCP family protein required for cell wall assembly
MPKSIKKVSILIIIFFILVITIYRFRYVFSTTTTIIFHHNAELAQTDGRTNVLLLGTGGAQHDGPNLTDTIIFASIEQKTGKIILISIPRDLWIPDIGQNGGKINEAYADGELNNQRKGLSLAKIVTGKVIGQPIHYGFRIDFNGFVKTIDNIGGIDVIVDNNLDDYHYPIDGQEENNCGHTDNEITQFIASNSSEIDSWDFFSCRYKHLHVDKGINHMDGITALAFVRSRHGVGSEGSDFARSHRQQEVIEAFRKKILSLGILFNPSKLINLYTILKDSIDVDIPQEDFIPFINTFQKLKNARIQTAVIDYGDVQTERAGLLVQPPITSQYNFESVLLPRTGSGNYAEIQAFVACEIKNGNCKVPETSVTPVAAKEK